jgi:hypothetical protein
MRIISSRLAWVSAAIASLVAFAAPAFADLRTFNSAVSAGDFRAASAAAAETWPQLSMAEPDITIIAREFAWASMLAGEPGRAQAYTSFLIGRSSVLRPDDPAIVTWRVLDAWATFAVRPTSVSRRALQDALQMRTAVVGKDLISLRAAQALFRDQWNAGLWRDASLVAGSGAHVALDFGQGFIDAFYQLEMGRLAASFVDRATPEAALYLKELAKRIYGDAIITTDPGMRERLINTFFAVDAWAEATSLRLQQQGKKGIPADRPDPTIPSRLTPAPGDPALPECQVTRVAGARQPDFPANRKFEGWPGFATYRLTLGEGGLFSEVKLMGAAPHTDLADTVGVAIGQWRWQFAGSAQPPDCRMPVYHYLAFQFDVPS